MSALPARFPAPRSVVEFTYQSQSIQFTEWISLLTLCLAPLIAHIVAGVPTPVYLVRQRAPWHSLLGHFNPTSILWRYLIITDRRARAKDWSALDMAASCALFWTRHGWDGSEEMMWKSGAICTRVPSLRRISFASVSMATTLIVTLQGAQAIYLPVVGYVNGNYAFGVAFSSIFSPLAFLGLMRLPAALWLTQDYSYADIDHMQVTGVDETEGLDLIDMTTKNTASSRAFSYRGLDERDGGRSVSAEERFYPSNSWRSIIIRFLFLVPLLGSVALSAAYIGQSQPAYGGVFFTSTHIVVVTFYLVLAIGIILTFSVYFWKGDTTNTVLPCIGATWYKVYTGILILLAVVAMVISGLETRKSTCGIYTTMRPSVDQFGCANM